MRVIIRVLGSRSDLVLSGQIEANPQQIPLAVGLRGSDTLEFDTNRMAEAAHTAKLLWLGTAPVGNHLACQKRKGLPELIPSRYQKPYQQAFC